MPIETVESIKGRMIRNASRMWGYRDVQDINSFDPVLGLIIGALAEELQNISEAIGKADARIVEKLLELLFSQNVFTHIPAHAVCTAIPVQPRAEINELYQFYFSKEIDSEKRGEGMPDKKNIYFTPTSKNVLLNGEIKYLLAGKHLFEINGRLREIVGEAPASVPRSNSVLNIGILLNPLTDLLDGLSLFFSFRNHQAEDRFYHALSNAKFTINGKTVEFENRIGTDVNGTKTLLDDLVKKESDISYRASLFINDIYRKRFMTLSDGNYRLKDFVNDFKVTGPLQEYFYEKNPEVFSKDILWLEIDLGLPFSFSDLNDLVVTLNCFPVVNRELNEYTHSVVKGANVIPLYTDDLFFDIRRVSDSSERTYKPRISADRESENENSYLVRQGGIARFDSRDARESIKNLMGLVRDEAAAFAIKGTDLISYELKQLDQIIARLQQRIDTNGAEHDLNSYLILESGNEYDKINVQYWTISGELANNIRQGSALSVYRGVDVRDKSVVLMTQTTGGRQKLSGEDKLNSLRRSLLSKGRVVTAEDIKALCLELFGNNITKVEVKKGIDIIHQAGKGMVRTIDIHIFLKDKSEIASDEVYQKTEILKLKLKRESVNLLPYRIMIS